MLSLKRTWFFMKPFKLSIFITVISLILLQIFSIFSPLVVRELIDNQILGIELPFYEVNHSGDKTVSLDGKYYSQERNFEDGDKVSDDVISVVYIGSNFYKVNDKVEPGTREKSDDTLVVTSNGEATRYQLNEMSDNEIKLFYNPQLSIIYTLMIVLIVLPIIQTLINVVQRRSFSTVIVGMTRNMRRMLVEKLHKLPISYFDAEHSGKTANRIIRDISGPTTIFDKLLYLGFSSILGFVLAFVGMFYLDQRLAMITMAIMPFIILWSYIYVRVIRKIAEPFNEVASMLMAKLNEYINGITLIRLFNFEKGALKEYDKLGNDYNKLAKKEVFLHLTLGWNMIDLLKNIIVAAVVVYFGLTKMNNPYILVSAGTIYAYQDLMGRIIAPISSIFKELGTIEHASVKTNRVFHVLDSKEENDQISEVAKFDGNIKFDHVWFSYARSNKPALRDVTFSVAKGEFVGIVGHTGSGKSTLMSLLMRFYDLDDSSDGQIYIDNLPIDHFSKRTYRQHVGIILQDPVLFEGTLAENIKFGNEDVTDELIIATLTQIGGEAIIEKETLGIHQLISRNGDNLSLGERQIISFARALVKNPSILILDEATANIDSETEKFMQNALLNAAQARTVFVIAHRLATIQKADKIIVLREGEVIEVGGHDELLHTNGVYSQLHYAQEQGEFEH